MLRPASAVAVLAALTLLVVPASSPAASCSVSGKEQKLGTTYVTSVSKKRTTCRRALRLVKAYHRCRHERGGADGRCPEVRGYTCSERKLSDSPTQYDARATCKRGRKRVTQVYTQNT